MINRISKRTLFSISALFGALVGAFGYAKANNQTISDLVLDNPLVSIERTYAMDGGAGDCCGSSTNDSGTVTWPEPSSSGIVISSTNI